MPLQIIDNKQFLYNYTAKNLKSKIVYRITCPKLFFFSENAQSFQK